MQIRELGLTMIYPRDHDLCAWRRMWIRSGMGQGRDGGWRKHGISTAPEDFDLKGSNSIPFLLTEESKQHHLTPVHRYCQHLHGTWTQIPGFLALNPEPIDTQAGTELSQCWPIGARAKGVIGILDPRHLDLLLATASSAEWRRQTTHEAPQYWGPGVCGTEGLDSPSSVLCCDCGKPGLQPPTSIPCLVGLHIEGTPRREGKGQRLLGSRDESV